MSDRHPSRTEAGLMKIRDLATNVVFERHPPDAAEMVRSGACEYVPADTPSVREILAPKSTEELFGLLGRPYNPDFHGGTVDTAGLRNQLLPMVEQGTVTLPEFAPQPAQE